MFITRLLGAKLRVRRAAIAAAAVVVAGSTFGVIQVANAATGPAPVAARADTSQAGILGEAAYSPLTLRRVGSRLYGVVTVTVKAWPDLPAGTDLMRIMFTDFGNKLAQSRPYPENCTFIEGQHHVCDLPPLAPGETREYRFGFTSPAGFTPGPGANLALDVFHLDSSGTSPFYTIPQGRNLTVERPR
jgi:hypothetical protein